MMQDVSVYRPGRLSANILTVDFQVEERRTPLQLSMDELAKKLSLMSFGVIGIICLIGVMQQRSWLEMFTIGGTYVFARIFIHCRLC
jgi:magnesium-transporting ATPase (P-type)